MSENIAPFGDSGPNNLSVKMSIKHVATREMPQHLGHDPHRFAQYVDRLVCGKINHRFRERWPAIDVSPLSIHGRKRPQSIARTRHLVTVLLRDFGWSFPQIGRHFSRDHTTIQSGFNRGMALINRPGVFPEVYYESLEELKAMGFKPRLFS